MTIESYVNYINNRGHRCLYWIHFAAAINFKVWYSGS